MDTIRIFDTPRDPTLDIGEVATIDCKHRNTTPISLPNFFGEVFHVEIGYGCNTDIHGIRYTILLVDRDTRVMYIYPLKNLQGDIKLSLQ